ncbi:unnamed protein product [Rotaria sp. Silwood2]|nr:unnamed protein product [Rotaria sp. Silwood2]
MIIENIACWGLTMDDQKFLYVTDIVKHFVKRYQVGEKNGTVVAGGHGRGDQLDQLNDPSYVFVDGYHSIYVSDRRNHRVVKWLKDAKEGVVVAGGQGQGSARNQLSSPRGVFVDLWGTVYVADAGNNRVMRWRRGALQGDVIVGGNGDGQEADQLNDPKYLTFDRYGNLYVSDRQDETCSYSPCECSLACDGCLTELSHCCPLHEEDENSDEHGESVSPCNSVLSSGVYSHNCCVHNTLIDSKKTIELCDTTRKHILKLQLSQQYPFFQMDLKQIWDENLPTDIENQLFISDDDLRQFSMLNKNFDIKRSQLRDIFKLKFQAWKQRLPYKA